MSLHYTRMLSLKQTDKMREESDIDLCKSYKSIYCERRANDKNQANQRNLFSTYCKFVLFTQNSKPSHCFQLCHREIEAGCSFEVKREDGQGYDRIKGNSTARHKDEPANTTMTAVICKHRN
jgi:hypothetical protein